jgi:hypothetical protein
MGACNTRACAGAGLAPGRCNHARFCQSLLTLLFKSTFLTLPGGCNHARSCQSLLTSLFKSTFLTLPGVGVITLASVHQLLHSLLYCIFCSLPGRCIIAFSLSSIIACLALPLLSNTHSPSVHSIQQYLYLFIILFILGFGRLRTLV